MGGVFGCFLLFSILSQFFKSYFVPIVGIAAIPIGAVAAGAPELGWLVLGAGTAYWLLMFSLLFLRLFFVGPLTRYQMPMLLMAVAPPALIVTSYSTLAGGTDVFGRMLFGVAFFNLVLFVVIRIGSAKAPFSLAHWSQVFPICAFAQASQRYAATVGLVSPAASSLTIMVVSLAVALATLAWFLTALLTIYYAMQRKLSARESKALSEETAHKVMSGKIQDKRFTSQRSTQRSTQRDTMREEKRATLKEPLIKKDKDEL